MNVVMKHRMNKVLLAVLAVSVFIAVYVSSIAVRAASSIASPAGELKVNDSVTVYVDGTEIEYLKFTAEETSVYSFVSSYEKGANVDPFGYIYDYNVDEGWKQYREDDDSAGDSNFHLAYSVKKGQTIYIGVRNYDSESKHEGNITVSCAYADMSDISNHDYVFNDYYGLGFVESDLFSFTDSEDITYEIYYASESTWDDGLNDYIYTKGIPDAYGSYKLKVVGTGDYKGEITEWIEIIDDSDISENSYTINGCINYNSEGITASDIIQFPNDKVTFNISYSTDGGENWIDGVPQDIGWYDIKITGTGDYIGEIYSNIHIDDFYDIINVYINVSNYLYDGKPCNSKTITLTDPITQESLEEGKDYKIVGYCTYDEELEKDVVIEELPSDAGYWTIKLEGIGEYHGEAFTTIWIIDSLKKIEYYSLWDGCVDGTPLGDTILKIEYMDGTGELKENVLEYGKDYECTKYCYASYNEEDDYYYIAEDSEWKTGAPTEVGKYGIYIVGKGEYSGEASYVLFLNEMDPYVKIYTNMITFQDMKSESIQLNIGSKETSYLKICPSESDDYRFLGGAHKEGDDQDISDIGYIFLYDEDGNNLCYTGGNELSEYLEAGKTYYIGVYNSNDYAITVNAGLKGDNVTYKFLEQKQDDNPKPDDKDKKDDKKTDKKDDKSSQSADDKKTDDTKTDTPQAKAPLAKGKKFKIGKNEYKVTVSQTGAAEVAYTKNTNKKATSVTIGATVTYDGVTYKVTSVGAKAFKGNKKLKKVVIGANVKSIAANAFYGCKSLKTIIINSKVLKSVGKNAIKGINKKAVIKAPKAKLKNYKKLFKAKTGFKKTMKIKKK